MIRPVIDRVGLNVLDLEESLRFCREMFGFSVIARWENPRQAFVGAGSTVLGLMEMRTYDLGQYTLAHLLRRASVTEVAPANYDARARVT